MSTQVFVVFSNPTEGNDETYNEWYDHHVDHLVGLEGFVSGQRLRLDRGMGAPDPPYRYAVLYEVEGDGEAARRSMKNGLRDGSIDRSPAVDWDGMQGWFFTPMGERRTAPTR